MTDTYAKFDKATAQFTACALLWQGQPVGRVVVKYGAAATAFVQIWGAPMATGRATGYGYDKTSAAVMAAIGALMQGECPIEHYKAFDAIGHVQATWNGSTIWNNALQAAGFTIANVI